MSYEINILNIRSESYYCNNLIDWNESWYVKIN